MDFQRRAELALQKKVQANRKETFEQIFKQPIDTKWAEKLKEGIKNEQK